MTPPGEEKPGDFGETLIQSGEALARAKDTTGAAGVVPSAAAPKIPGYTLTTLLGQGAFAQVWKARQERTGKIVAIKVFTRRSGVDWLLLQREVERLSKLDKHPHIVSLLDADLGGDVPWYALDLMEGGSLEKYVDLAKPVPAEAVARWMAEIADALAFVHSKGIIHCDLKPGNVMLDEQGRIRVADYGQARVLSEATSSLGTLFYMAPEQANVPKEGESIQPDVRWDIYALGATAYALLTGTAPHEESLRDELGTSPTTEARLAVYRDLAKKPPLRSAKGVRGKAVDEDLSAIVGKCLAVDPNMRYGSAAEVVADLKARTERRPVSPLAGRRSYRMKKFLGRNKWMVAVSTAAIAGLMVASVQLFRDQAAVRLELARAYITRAQQLCEKGDDVMAALYYAESNRIRSSHLACAGARSLSDGIPTPKKDLLPGEVYFDHTELSKDGRLVIGPEQGDATTLKIMDTAGGTAFMSSVKLKGEIRFSAISSDNGRIAVSCGGAFPVLLNGRTGEVVKELPVDGEARSMSFSSDSKILLTMVRNSSCAKWSLKNRKTAKGGVYNRMSVWGLEYSPDRSMVATHSFGVKVLDTVTDTQLGKVIGSHDAWLYKFNPDGSCLGVCDDADKSFQQWNPRSGEPMGIRIECKDPIADLAYSPDGKRIAGGTRKGEIVVWNLVSGKVLFRKKAHKGEINDVIFSPDGRLIFTGGKDGMVCRWDSGSGKTDGEAIRHDGGVADMFFAMKGEIFVTVCADNIVRLWSAATCEPAGKSIRHTAGLNDYVLSPDGRYLVTCCVDGFARLWDAATGDQVGKQMGHDDIATSADFSPDGLYLATGSFDGKVRIWSLPGCDPVGLPIRHGGLVWHVKYSSDGQWIRAISWDDSLMVWDAGTGNLVGGPWWMPTNTGLAVISPDGSRCVVTSANIAYLVNLKTGKVTGSTMYHDARIYGAIFSEDGSKVLTYGEDKKARIWNGMNGRAIGMPIVYEEWINAADFSPDGGYVAIGSGDYTARVWDTKTGLGVGPSLRHEARVISVEYEPDGRTLATGTSTGVIQLWDVKTGAKIGRPMTQKNWAGAIRFLPDGKSLIVSGDKVCLWNLPRDETAVAVLRHEIRPDSKSPRSVIACFSPDGGRIVTGGDDGIARLWNGHAGEALGKPMKMDGPNWVVRFSPDGSLVLATGGNSAQTFDGRTGEPVSKPMPHEWVVSAAFSPDGRLVATGNWSDSAQNRRVMIWNARTGDPVGKPIPQSQSVGTLVFSPKGDRLLACDWGSTAVMWNPITGDQIGKRMLHNNGISTATFSTDGRRLATGCWDGTVRIWDGLTAEPVMVGDQPVVIKQGREGMVHSVVFSRDGRRVLAAGMDTTARIWDATTGKQVGKSMRHSEPALGAVFTPDERAVVTACRDGTARIWDTATGENIGKPLLHGSPVNSVAVSPDGRWVITGGLDQAARLWPTPWLVGSLSAKHLQLLVGVKTMSRIDEEGNVVPIEPKDLAAMRKKLAAVGEE